MNSLYELATGPLVWAAFIIGLGGLIVRLAMIVNTVKTRDPNVATYLKPKWALRSWIAWLIPFYATRWRTEPSVTVATFTFHLCMLIAPLFALGHVVMLEEALGISYATLSDSVVDVLAILVVLSGCFFLYRRLAVPKVAYVTDWKDYALLAVAVAPFLTGTLAYHQVIAYKPMILAHVLLGELWLVLLPFSRLAHMILGPFIRAYVGSEFGGVRHVKDW